MRILGRSPIAILLGLVALAGAVWLLGGLHDARRIADAQELIQKPGGLDPAAVAEADRLLVESNRWALDPSPQRLRGALFVLAGRPEEGVALIERAVEREPENSEAWALLASATARSDPQRSAQARERLEALNPAAATARR
ncbi:MAG: tetratricopeptide repeat protein [Solirubrobacterales bacterium]